MGDLSISGMNNNPIKVETLGDKVFKRLEKEIINMNISPGKKLIEDDIAEILQVSRSPVREAMLRLKHVGLIEKENGGWYVKEITEERIMENYQVWEMIESFASGFACQNASKKNIEQLEKIIDKMDEFRKEDSLMKYRQYNYEFHRHLIMPCPNKKIVEMHNNILNHIEWCYNYSLTWENDLACSSTDHHKILEAYKNKEDNVLESFIKKHIKDASKRFQKEFSKKSM